MPLDGHLWTIRPWLAHALRPRPAPASVPWTTVLDDPRAGSVRLHGRLSPRPGADTILVILHGLGGDLGSHYVLTAAAAAERAGMPALCLNLRGAGGDGEDLYNAGLTADLRAAIESPELRDYQAIFVLGYSLGGHIALRYATEAVSHDGGAPLGVPRSGPGGPAPPAPAPPNPLDPRVRAVASVCAPLDLDLSAAEIDRPERWVYRRHLLGGLKAAYAAFMERRRGPGIAAREAARIRTIREWDGHVVAPRFGFRSAEHYYAEQSVAPRLPRLAVPALLVAATDDPMVPERTLRPGLAGGHPLLDVRWIAPGGHVGFPRGLDLGLGGEGGLEPQILRWFTKVGRTSRLSCNDLARGDIPG
jgi:hypothetical protein